MRHMDALDPLTVIPECHHRLTVLDYHRMIDAGVFDEDDHVELIEGVLVDMTPQSPPHAHVIQKLNAALVRGVGEAFDVRVQLPLTVSDLSEPEPDFAVVPSDEGAIEHPKTAVLVIEVARGSLKRDRVLKAPLYARAGVREYWISDVEGRVVEVFRDPEPAAGRYASTATVRAGSFVSPSAFPALKIAVAALFAGGEPRG